MKNFKIDWSYYDEVKKELEDDCFKLMDKLIKESMKNEIYNNGGSYILLDNVKSGVIDTILKNIEKFDFYFLIEIKDYINDIDISFDYKKEKMVDLKFYNSEDKRGTVKIEDLLNVKNDEIIDKIKGKKEHLNCIMRKNLSRAVKHIKEINLDFSKEGE